MARSREEKAYRRQLIDQVWRDSKEKGAFDSSREGRQMLLTMPKQLGVELPNIVQGADGKAFIGTIASEIKGKPTDYADYRRSLAATPYFVNEADVDRAMAKSYGVDQMTPELEQREYERARGRQAFVSSVHEASVSATEEALRNVGEMLSDDAVPDVVWKAMGINAEKLRAVYGNAAADGFQAEVSTLLGAGKVKEAIAKIGITDEQLKSVIPSNAVFDVPLLKDMPPWGQAAALAGAGAAAGGLAYHLMAQGQQQQSSADYAAAMQALNAY